MALCKHGLGSVAGDVSYSASLSTLFYWTGQLLGTVFSYLQCDVYRKHTKLIRPILSGAFCLRVIVLSFLLMARDFLIFMSLWFSSFDFSPTDLNIWVQTQLFQAVSGQFRVRSVKVKRASNFLNVNWGKLFILLSLTMLWDPCVCWNYITSKSCFAMTQYSHQCHFLPPVQVMF